MKKIFILPVILLILSIVFAQLGIVFELIFKPLFVTSLIVLFIIYVDKNTKHKKFFLYFLICCLIGDTILITEKYLSNPTLKVILFAAGMAVYVFAYLPLGIFYVIKGKWSIFSTIASIVVVALSYFIYKLFTNIPSEILVPMVVYLGQALLLVIGSTTLLKVLPKSQAILFIAVALLFYISDSLIGINLFRANFPLAETALYSTYGLALLLAYRAFSLFQTVKK